MSRGKGADMSIEIKQNYLEIDGKPTFIYGGDLSYCRVPRRLWKDRMLQMKAAGMNTITVYVVWEWHQEGPGMYDFEGNKDIAAFLDLIKECGMYCIFRMGPFVHGEFHNGGLPQWIIDELGDKVRTNDPCYLQYAKEYYEKLIQIAKPRLYDNGGPIIMLQLENELGSAGCKGDDLARGSADVEENTKHLLFYYHLVRDAGLDVPLLDINHIPNKEEHIQNFVDAGGFYPINCFGSDGELRDFSTNWWDRHKRPCITIETGGGMFVRYYDCPAYRNTNSFQGPLVPPEIVEGAVVTHIAEGCSGVNIFIFCDGQNPDGCGESMLPEKNMNYQAPISVVGRRRASYYPLKRIGWFVRSFGQELLGSSPDPDWAKVRSFGIPHPGVSDGGDLFANYETVRSEDAPAKDTGRVPALARITKGLNLSESNFLFLKNVSNLSSGWKRDVRVMVSPSKLACEVWSEYPKKTQMELPPQTMKNMPFFVRLAKKNFLEYSTAELLDRREFAGKTQVVLCESNEVMTETRLVIPSTVNVKSTGNVLVLKESPNSLTLIAKPERSPIIVETDDLRIVLITKTYAERLWDVAESFAWCEAPLTDVKVIDGTEKNLQMTVKTESEDFCMEWMTPEVPRLLSGVENAQESYDAERKIYRLSGSFALPKPQIVWKRSYEGDDLVLTANVGPALLEGVSDVVLTLQHDGMIGRAYFEGTLISDHSFGRFLPWEIGLAGDVDRDGELRIVIQSATRCETETAVQADKVLTFAK